MITWYRPTALDPVRGVALFTRWCAIRCSERGSSITFCGDRWPADVTESAMESEVECEMATDPLDKCPACVAALTVTRGLSELRDAPAIRTADLHTAPRDGVLFEAEWDRSDIGEEG